MVSLRLFQMSTRHLALQGNYLRSPAKPVDVEMLGSPAFKEIVFELFRLMYDGRGVGLAAPMAGLGLQIMVIDVGDEMPRAFVNPQIVGVGGQQVIIREGNLCIPRLFANVSRPERVSLTAIDVFGNTITDIYEGFLARVIFHEMDILNGSMFTDLIPPNSLFSKDPDILTANALTQLYGNSSSEQITTIREVNVIRHYLSPVTVSPSLLNLTDTVLRRKCEPVKLEAWNPDDLTNVIREMLWQQHNLRGVGLSAPQVGLSIQLSVVDDGDDPPLVLINPTIVEESEDTDIAPESCSSVPGYIGSVKRARRVTVHAWDLMGRLCDVTAQGPLARVIQHECDHLQGVMFTDHLESLELLHAVDPEAKAENALVRLFGAASN